MKNLFIYVLIFSQFFILSCSNNIKNDGEKTSEEISQFDSPEEKAAREMMQKEKIENEAENAKQPNLIDADMEAALLLNIRSKKPISPEEYALSEAYCKRGDSSLYEFGIKSDQNDYRSAIEDYTEAIKINPQNENAYNNRGNAKDNHHDYKGAIVDYNMVEELNPKDQQVYRSRGHSRYELKDYYGAIEDYTKAIEINPRYDANWTQRGMAMYELQDYRGAIADFNRVIEMNPKEGYVYYYRGMAKIRIGQKDGGCMDLSKAGVNGYGEAYEQIKKQCN